MGSAPRSGGNQSSWVGGEQKGSWAEVRIRDLGGVGVRSRGLGGGAKQGSWWGGVRSMGLGGGTMQGSCEKEWFGQSYGSWGAKVNYKQSKDVTGNLLLNTYLYTGNILMNIFIMTHRTYQRTLGQFRRLVHQTRKYGQRSKSLQDVLECQYCLNTFYYHCYLFSSFTNRNSTAFVFFKCLFPSTRRCHQIGESCEFVVNEMEYIFS